MKYVRKTGVLLLCVMVLCSIVLSGCRRQDGTQDTTAGTVSDELNYCVSILDAQGNPVTSGVIVQFLQDGQAVAMQSVNANGVAEKTLAAGEYTVTLSFTSSDASYYYDDTDLILTADQTSLEIMLYSAPAAQSTTLNAYSETKGESCEYEAYYVSLGDTYLNVDTADRNYYIFAPDEAGMYEFSVDVEGSLVGYYGGTFFVQTANLGTETESGIQVNFTPGMIGSSLVIGVDCPQENCVLSIRRTGDHQASIEEMPWTVYEATVTIQSFVLGADVDLKEFDLTAASDAYNLVLNEEDGFYHLDSADGPLVYAKLGVNSGYLDSIQTILDSSGIVKYTFDENGAFVEKVSYTECLMQYIACMDEASGLYPLTQDLMYIFQQRGEYVGWWQADGDFYLFIDDNGMPIPGINSDIAWLFLCCYGDINTAGMEETPATSPSEETEPDVTEVPETTEPATEATQSTTAATEPATVVTQPATAATEPATEATKTTATTPTESTTAPTEVPTEATEPPTVATEPPTEPTEPEKTIGKESSADTVEVFPNILNGSSGEFQATVKAGEYANYDLYRFVDMVLTIQSEDAYVVYNGKVYWPEDGVVSFALVYNNGYNFPCSFAIGNSSDEELTFDVQLGTPAGEYGNPTKLSLGTFTTNLEAGDEDGYWYTYTASKSGTFTITLNSCTSDCAILVQKMDVSGTVQEALYSIDSNTVSLKVEAGDVISINVGVDDLDYPAATIVAEASLK